MGLDKRAKVPAGAYAKPRYPNMLKERVGAAAQRARVHRYHR